jgi:phytoene desaturase
VAKKTKQGKRIVVIGAGIAGLAAAARLASKGNDVTVIEKNESFGGKLSSRTEAGYTWDMGPSFFTDKKEFDALFIDCGKKPIDYYSAVDIEEACRYFYDGGKVVHGYDNADKLAVELEEVLGEPRKNTATYMAEAAKVYNGVSSKFFDHNITLKNTTSTSSIAALSKIPLQLFARTLASHNATKFRTDEARAFFDRFATYNGSDPNKMPALFSCLPHLEHNLGAMYVNGGMRSLAVAVETLAKDLGAKFLYNTPAEKITTSEGSITGVITPGGWLEADIIVSAIDINYLYGELIEESKSVRRKYVDKKRSASAVVFLWAIDSLHPELSLHNIMFSSDYNKENKQIWKENKPAVDPTIYINITSKLDSSHAPRGGENWFVMINVPSVRNENWKNIVRKRTIKRINTVLGKDIEKSISHEQILDPEHFHNSFNSVNGAIYGAASNSLQSAFLRHPNKSPIVDNLYVIGVSAHPGGGIPLAIRSAKIVDGMLKQK